MSEISPNIPTEPTFSQKENEVESFLETICGLQEKYHIHGHGVSGKEKAVSIGEHGLYTAWSSLQDLTHPLTEDSSRLMNQIHAWDYEARQYIVFIAVPKREDYYASDVADAERSAWENRERSKDFAAEHVFESVEIPEGLQIPIGTNKRIPPKRIIGYWDDIQKTFNLNPRFEEE